MKKKNRITITNDKDKFWTVKFNEQIIAGFFDRSDAELFCEAKWPEFKNEE